MENVRDYLPAHKRAARVWDTDHDILDPRVDAWNWLDSRPTQSAPQTGQRAILGPLI
jgi:hypothetical protein